MRHLRIYESFVREMDPMTMDQDMDTMEMDQDMETQYDPYATGEFEA